MIWAKRRFEFGGYWPDQERLKALLLENPPLCRQFMMICARTERSHVGDYYIGVPDEAFLATFDGFDRVSESELPKEIDSLCVGDAASPEFRSRFGLPGPKHAL